LLFDSIGEKKKFRIFNVFVWLVMMAPYLTAVHFSSQPILPKIVSIDRAN